MIFYHVFNVIELTPMLLNLYCNILLGSSNINLGRCHFLWFFFKILLFLNFDVEN